MRRVLLFVLSVALIALTGCQVRSTARVDVNGDGSGSISVTARLDKEAATAVPNLKEQLQTSDLVKAGWSIDGPEEHRDGSKTITVRHGFRSPEEATGLLRRLSGNGAPFVDFQLQQERSLQNVETTFTGKIDMQQGINSFGDLGLTQSLGSRLGFDPSELERSLGVDWATTFPLDVEVHMPGGKVKRQPETDETGAWHATYGEITPISATASGTNARPLVFFAMSAASLLACLLVLLVWRSGKYRPRHKKNGVRARDLLNQQP